MLRFIRKVALSSLKTNSWKIPLCTKALACTHFASSTVTLIPLLLTKHVADCSTIQKKNWKQVFCNRLSYNLLFIAAALFLFNYWVVIRENENRFSGSKENHAFYNKYFFSVSYLMLLKKKISWVKVSWIISLSLQKSVGQPQRSNG